MRFVGIDLHKRSMTVCVIDKTTGETFDRRFPCSDVKAVRDFFQGLRPFQAVLEASATYEWLWEVLEPLAERLVLAHPRKLTIIAESMKKTDKHDAFFLAWLLSIDAIPEAHRPSPRRRQYQHLVKHRVNLVRTRTKLITQIRSILAAKNYQGPVITPDAQALIAKLNLSDAEHYRIEDLFRSYDTVEEQLEGATCELAKFRKGAPEEEKKFHKLLTSVPGVGNVVADVILATLGDMKRFRNARKCAAYAGLAPGFRESGGKRQELGITKEGPSLLRWALVQAAWAAVLSSWYWREDFEAIAKRRGKKKAIVAIARRLLVVIHALAKKGEPYKQSLALDKRLSERPKRKSRRSA